MIRTHITDCHLRKTEADALNRASAERYTQVMLFHWRTYRHTGHWLSQGAAERWNDRVNTGQLTVLHAHSIDAAQQGFYKACKTARSCQRAGLDVRYPHKRKRYRTTIWKQSGIRRQGDALVLSRAKGQPPITIVLPNHLRDVLQVREVRLLWDRRGRRYSWHLVVESGKQPKDPAGTNVVAVDLGEIHPASVTDGTTAVLITCRELRATRQYTAKRLAYLTSKQSKCKKQSRRWWKLQRCKTRFRAKQRRRIRDAEHKISRAIVEYAIERQAGTLAIGDVRDVADQTNKGKVQNQKLATWAHGRLRAYTTYKAEAEGMDVVLVDEHYTSQTCPHCGRRHKPKGRVYRCPACRFQAHRDTVGAANILSRQTTGEVGNALPPSFGQTKYRIPLRRVLRSRPDTGQPVMAVACHKQEAAGL